MLGIETSCDETAAAVVRGREILSSKVRSQIELHASFGGVVPEIASRSHLVELLPVIRAALDQASVAPEDLCAIAVTAGPGLIGALLSGLETAKALALVLQKPLIGVNHLEGHLLSVLFCQPPPDFPFVGLVASGGHTSLYLAHRPGEYEMLGCTRDDAAGESLDKVGKVLGLPYPGGVALDRLAAGGDRSRWRFPRVMSGQGLDFSFSGLKTAAVSRLRKLPEPLTGAALADFAAGYVEAVADSLVSKASAAVQQTQVARLVLAGGVAANRRLREKIALRGRREGFTVFPAPLELCGDNGAMIALAGSFALARGRADDLSLNARARWPLGAQNSQWLPARSDGVPRTRRW